MKEIEVWKDIEGYEGHYQVSNKGRVKSFKLNREKILKLETQNGYKSIKIHGDNSRYIIGRLVLTTFTGPPPNDGLLYDCCHNNGKKGDNRLSNLRWDSRRKNVRDKIKHDTYGWKLKELEVISILRLYKSGLNSVQLSNLYPVHQATIRNIVNKKAWSYLHGKTTN